jgi:hypothetical protein
MRIVSGPAPQVSSTAVQSGIPHAASGRAVGNETGSKSSSRPARSHRTVRQRESVQSRIAGSSVAYFAVEPVVSFQRIRVRHYFAPGRRGPRRRKDRLGRVLSEIDFVASRDGPLPSLPSSDGRLVGFSCHLGSTELESSDIA